VKLLEDYGLDGLDVDYEYPGDDAQARGYAALLEELRCALDDHAKSKSANYKFLLTVGSTPLLNLQIIDSWQIAAPCGRENYEKLHIKEMDKHLDFWNMMAYDFCQLFRFTSTPLQSLNLTIHSRLLGLHRKSPGEHSWWQR
jgi:chitinase